MRRPDLLTAAALTVAGLLACSQPAAEPAASPAGAEAPNFAGTAATASPGPRYGLGRSATGAQIAAVDIDVGTDGEGLPAGKGSVANGAELYQAKCSMCHGPKGEGMGNVYPALIGPSPAGGFEAFARDPGLPRTVGNYWSHATTLYDYVRRAMPLTAPGSLTNDEVYALAAYLLAENEVIPRDAMLDSTSLMAVKMPARDRFVPDDRRGGPALK
jgi:mono/diheme cytochrome c family protein